MSAGPRVKSGLPPISKTSPALFEPTSARRENARYFRSILRLVETKLRASASHPDRTLLLLYRSRTPDQRAEAIGQLRKLSASVGSLYVRSLRIQKYTS